MNALQPCKSWDGLLQFKSELFCFTFLCLSLAEYEIFVRAPTEAQNMKKLWVITYLGQIMISFFRRLKCYLLITLFAGRQQS